MARRITSVSFRNYKAFSTFSVSLQEFNILVGPNNAGKSTVISAFRILAEGIRKARSKQAERLEVEGTHRLGYRVEISDLPIASENIFHDYDVSSPAEVSFRLSNGNHLKLHFPELGTCFLIPESDKDRIQTTGNFKAAFDVAIGFVPILGPVEQREPLYQKEAARRALLSNGASRNFRNIWYHFPEQFEAFREMVQMTWPGMDIQKPEFRMGGDRREQQLQMFCPEERHAREICWAGYGFQVWCQMLTYIVQAREASILVIDEPDIYLHSDLQRQLVAVLRELGPDILIATHSTEIISEADPTSLLSINKKLKSASRIKDASQLRPVFVALGSNLNPTLTQLAKTKRAVFVEGLDFDVLSRVARILKLDRVANRSDFALIPLEGFNPKRMIDIANGVELTIGNPIARAVILDRDYRSDGEVERVKTELAEQASLVFIHPCKEIENYLLNPIVVTRAVEARLAERARRSDAPVIACPNIAQILSDVTDELRSAVLSQLLARQTDEKKRHDPKIDLATLSAPIIADFEKKWSEPSKRLTIVPGKEVLSRLNTRLQQSVAISVSAGQIASSFRPNEIHQGLRDLLAAIEIFRAHSSTQS